MEKVAFTLLFLLLWVSCQEDLDEIEEGYVDKRIGITGSVLPMDSGSSLRTSMSGSTASFASGDAVGVSETLTQRYNQKFTYNGTAWTPATAMYWYNGNSTHTFYAYYPYNGNSQSLQAAIPVLNNQVVGVAPDPACDFLMSTAKTQARSAGTNVAFTFTHAFSLLQFNVKMNILGLGVTLYNLQSVTLTGGNASGTPYGLVNKVNAVSQVYYNQSTRALQYPVNTSSTLSQTYTSNTISSVSIGNSTSMSIYVFILPGTYTYPSATGPTVSFKVSTLLGLVSLSSTQNLGTATFLPGTKYVYQVTIGLLPILSSGTQVKFLRKEPMNCEVRRSIP